MEDMHAAGLRLKAAGTCKNNCARCSAKCNFDMLHLDLYIGQHCSCACWDRHLSAWRAAGSSGVHERVAMMVE